MARVSQTPGKTQAVYFYLVNERFYVVDLPGYGYAKAPRTAIAAWGRLVRSYIEGSESLRMIFLLLDARHQPSGQDLGMVEWMNQSGTPWRAVLTKTDKLSKSQLARSARMIAETIGRDPADLIFFSKVTRLGVEPLWQRIDAELINKAPRKAVS
jgi:GTP-binding protein